MLFYQYNHLGFFQKSKIQNQFRKKIVLCFLSLVLLLQNSTKNQKPQNE